MVLLAFIKHICVLANLPPFDNSDFQSGSGCQLNWLSIIILANYQIITLARNFFTRKQCVEKMVLLAFIKHICVLANLPPFDYSDFQSGSGCHLNWLSIIILANYQIITLARDFSTRKRCCEMTTQVGFPLANQHIS